MINKLVTHFLAQVSDLMPCVTLFLKYSYNENGK